MNASTMQGMPFFDEVENVLLWVHYSINCARLILNGIRYIVFSMRYAYGCVLFCFVVVMLSFLVDSCNITMLSYVKCWWKEAKFIKFRETEPQ